MRILISRLSALGDVVCSRPAAVAMKRTFPDSHVTWVVDPRFAGIVECCKSVDEVVRFKPKLSVKSLPKFDGPFDVAMDLQGLLKSALGIARADSPLKLGYHWQREGSQFFSSAVLPDPTSFHIVDQYVDVARAAGAQVDRAEFDLCADDIDTIMIRDPYVVMNAGAGWVTKRWPAASFADLSRRVNAVGLKVVLIGGKAAEDRAVGDSVKNAGGEFIDLIGETGIRELAAIISGAKAHIGGDTGSSHIAAALGVPAIGLYSITNPRRSCPYGQFDRCLYEPDGLAKITPERVFSKLTESIG